MRHWDSNSRPLGQESPPLTTRPGLPHIETQLTVLPYFNQWVSQQV